MTEEWVETNNSACKILRQVHDMLALASVPPRKTWVNLTDDEIAQCSYDENGFMIDRQVAMRATETKLKEKNSG